MNPAECILFSGGAPGAEAAFGEAAERHGVQEVNFTFEGHAIARRRGTRVLTREELMRDVWGWSDPATARSGTRTVDSHVRSLRAKIGAGRVRTVHGVGYALEEVGVS